MWFQTHAVISLKKFAFKISLKKLNIKAMIVKDENAYAVLYIPSLMKWCDALCEE